MPALSIHRSGGYPDWMRSYRIFVDGEDQGSVKHNETRTIEVANGRHEVQLRMDWSSSAVVAVDVDDAGTTLACGPTARSGWSFLSLSRPVADTMWLRPQAPGADAGHA